VTFFVGVDLAQRDDFTAIAIGEKIRHADAKPDLHVRYLRRMRGVSYPQVADFVREVMAWPALNGAELYADATGVGRAIVDLMRERGLSVRPVVITGGDNATREGSEHHVPKRDLVAAVQVLLQTRRLHVARELAEADNLASELGNFAVNINARGHDTYNAAGSGHDDLVIAVALIAWAMNQGQSIDDWAAFYRETYTKPPQANSRNKGMPDRATWRASRYGEDAPPAMRALQHLDTAEIRER
jgi:hypothetical protein